MCQVAGLSSMKAMEKTYIDPASIRKQIAALDNVEAFARKTGIPLRTLQRIKAAKKGDKYKPNQVTLMAISAALQQDAAPSAGDQS